MLSSPKFRIADSDSLYACPHLRGRELLHANKTQQVFHELSPGTHIAYPTATQRPMTTYMVQHLCTRKLSTRVCPFASREQKQTFASRQQEQTNGKPPSSSRQPKGEHHKRDLSLVAQVCKAAVPSTARRLPPSRCLFAETPSFAGSGAGIGNQRGSAWVGQDNHLPQRLKITERSRKLATHAIMNLGGGTVGLTGTIAAAPSRSCVRGGALDGARERQRPSSDLHD